MTLSHFVPRFALVADLAGGAGAAGLAWQAPEPVDAAVNARIRAEGLDRSQVANHFAMLVDVIGPRLTGSPEYKRAADTDHLSFIAAGVPGFNPIQDYTDYDVREHHTNADLAERIKEQDLRQNAVILASFLYHAAMRTEMLPSAARK